MPIIEGHHDFAILETRLATLLLEAQREAGASLPAPVAVVAPTLRLISDLRLRLAALAPSLLNVHFFHHKLLADKALAASGLAVQEPLSDDVRAAIVARLLEARGGSLAAYARARPGSVSSILATLDDLRESGTPSEAPTPIAGLTDRGRELLRIYADYARALDSPAAGLCDRAASILRAVPAVRQYARRFRLVVHYGAYDLIGVNLELMRAAETSSTRLVFLVPNHPTSRAYDLARRFWPEFLAVQPKGLADAESDRLLADRLPRLYDEAAEPGPLPGDRRDRVEFFHAQGAAAELREVALRILALHRDERVPLHRIGVLSRSLEPYAAELRPVFEDHGLPFETTASLGALREARAQAALQLARALLRDFPRQPLMDLCRGGLLRLGSHDPATEAHAWDRLSRDWHIAGGFTAWTRDLMRWVDDWRPHIQPDADEGEKERAAARKAVRRRQAGALAALVKDLQRAGRPLTRASSWTDWVDSLVSLLIGCLDGFAAPEGAAALDPGAAVVLRVLRDMRRLDAAGISYAGPAALSFFEQALARNDMPIGALGGAGSPGLPDHGGVRVLDAMQARGLSFDSVFLIGFNADLFPPRRTEDPFLPDADRRALRAAFKVPLPIKGSALEEERLLLAHLLGSAARRLTVSWQRADETGRAKVPSLALREVARLVDGSPDMRRLEAGARRVLTHPAEAGQDALQRFGMLPPQDAAVLAALQARSPRVLLDALPRGVLPFAPESLDALRPGLAMLAVVEEFTPADLRFDAFVGAAAPPASRFSPSRLEILGACPQHYFFRHILLIEELDEVRETYELEAREIGSKVHAVLRDVFAGLIRSDGSLPDEPADETARRAAGLARAAWMRHTRDIAGRTTARYPLLWRAIETLWFHTLDRFLRDDLAALLEDGARLVGLEREESGRISLGADGRGLDLRGRFDRLGVGAAGLIVSDYKTSGKLARQVSPAQILKGMSLQLPLYLLLLESLSRDGRVEAPPARADVLGVGPAFPPGRGDEDTRVRVTLEMSTLAKYRDGFAETLGTLLDLARTGSFPLNRSSWLCESCAYVRACRRWHVPTMARVRSAPDGRDYALLRRKSSLRPMLDQVRDTGANEEDG